MRPDTRVTSEAPSRLLPGTGPEVIGVETAGFGLLGIVREARQVDVNRTVFVLRIGPNTHLRERKIVEGSSGCRVCKLVHRCIQRSLLRKANYVVCASPQ